MFHGSIVALVTPMQPDGAVDYSSLHDLVEWHISSHTDGLVILGSTGESATIEPVERRQIVERVINQVNERIPVIVGTGSYSTHHAIQLTKQAMEMGADAALIVTPYYNKPTQEGLYQHFSLISDKVPLPQILYNVPSRTGCDLLPETILRISRHANIIGVKEATGDLSRLEKLKEMKLDLFSGDDSTAAEFMLGGGKGSISAVANVIPKAIHNLCKAATAGQREEALELDQKLRELYKVLFCETNPIAIKWALAEKGIIKSGIRLPLTPLNDRYHEAVRTALLNADWS